jgi:hypothetical protein
MHTARKVIVATLALMITAASTALVVSPVAFAQPAQTAAPRPCSGASVSSCASTRKVRI